MRRIVKKRSSGFSTVHLINKTCTLSPYKKFIYNNSVIRYRLPLKREKVSQNERNSSAKTSGTSPSWIPSKRPQACHALEIKSTEIPGPFQHRKNKNRKDLKCRNGCFCDQGLKLKTIRKAGKLTERNFLHRKTLNLL